ncbi:MAG TPA: hypothetical protein VME46_26535 [Acidimicrobiales bacterium]|nr:hypothetical protein [Acidimicrobiales bacterium]
MLPEGPLPGDNWPVPPGGWPPAVWQVPYEPQAVPGCEEPSSWLKGADCQRYAYGVLSLFGLFCPPLRSSELWADTSATTLADQPAPLDLALFNATNDPFGAHVGLWMGRSTLLHLCREVGRPTAWSFGAFKQRPRYATLIGFKRVGPMT